MLVKKAPKIMTRRNKNERMAEEKRKVIEYMFPKILGGPYSGNGGNRGFVFAGGIARLNGASAEVDCRHDRSCGG